MLKTADEITKDIQAYIVNNGGDYSEWYTGITSDPEKRLFTEHGVDKENNYWICRQAINNTTARNIEEYFVKVLHTDGGSGGGDETTVFVYIYKKNYYTKP